MYTGSIFRICLIASISAHLAFFVPWPFLHLQSRPKVPFQKLELTYLNRNKTPEKPAVKITAPTVPKLSALPEIKPPAANIIKPDSGQDVAKNPLVKKEEKLQIAASHVEKKNDNGNVIDIGAQKGVVYEKYYLDVREKIRDVIEKNRKGLLKESEVCIKFIVERNGALKDLYLYKSSGADAGSLENLAVKSIKEAAPFHPFTDKIKEDELQFNLPIRVIRRD